MPATKQRGEDRLEGCRGGIALGGGEEHGAERLQGCPLAGIYLPLQKAETECYLAFRDPAPMQGGTAMPTDGRARGRANEAGKSRKGENLRHLPVISHGNKLAIFRARQ